MDLIKPIKQLVIAARLAPKGRCRVAVALADLHDTSAGQITAPMAFIAELASLSTAQARKHVHALVDTGLLRVLANAHGGTPGVAPEYAFDRGLLEQLAGRNPDLFTPHQEEERCIANGEAYQFSSGGAQFLAYLMGEPGGRRVVFWRLDGSHRTSYGDVRLKTLLRDYRGRRGWHCHLAIDGDEEAPIETMVGLTPAETAALAAWAQAAALGRNESVETA